MAGLIMGAVLVLAVASWVAALVWSLLRFLELVVVGAICGWIGWRLGQARARRPPD